MNEINKSIKQAQNEIAKGQAIHNRLLVIREILTSLSKKIKIHESVINKELQDVLKLEKLNVQSLFVKFIGDLEHRLDKERQEYLHAVLRHQSMTVEVQVLMFEQKLLRKKKINITSAKAKLSRLYKEKEAKLKKDNTLYYKQFIALDKKKAILLTPTQKCKEAIAVGKKTIRSIESILRDLLQVAHWGSASMYHGKGRYSSMKKKSYIDKANKKMSMAKILVDNYELLVERIFSDIDVQLSLESFENFIDIFLDNLITDWVIQGKIKNAIRCLEMSVDKIVRHNFALANELKLLKQKIKEVDQEKKDLLKAF